MYDKFIYVVSCFLSNLSEKNNMKKLWPKIDNKIVHASNHGNSKLTWLHNIHGNKFTKCYITGLHKLVHWNLNMDVPTFKRSLGWVKVTKKIYR